MAVEDSRIDALGADMDLSKYDIPEELKAQIAEQHNSELAGLKAKRDELLEKQAATKTKLDGLDLDAINALVKKAKTDDEAELIKAGRYDEVMRKNLDDQQSQLQAQIDAYKTEADTAKQEKADAETRWQDSMLDSLIRSGANSIKDIHQSAADDLVMRAKAAWKVVDGKHQAFNGDTPILKDGKPISARDWIEGMREPAPHYFNQAKGAGSVGGKGGGDNLLQYFKGDTANLTKQAEIEKSDPALFQQLMTEAQGATATG